MKLRPNTLTGEQIDEHRLGTVPSAVFAAPVLTGNRVFATYRRGPQIDVPDALAPIAALNLPAGKYLVLAKATMFNAGARDSTVDLCRLQAGAGTDDTPFDVGAAPVDDQETYLGTLVYELTAPGTVQLLCTDNGVGALKAQGLKISAVQVGGLVNAAF